MKINQHSPEWQIIKAELNTMVGMAREQIEFGVTEIDYNFYRGQIALAKELIERVEPTRPPVTTEEDYGISDPV